jgi:5-methyltetrahydrofolate--homocysteine methyltransferase
MYLQQHPGNTMSNLRQLVTEKIVVLDGATGTEIQRLDIPESVWEGSEGCNELLNITFPEAIKGIHNAYLLAGADIIKTNTFGTMPWVLDEYDMGDRSYELAYAGAKLALQARERLKTDDPRFIAGSLGPGTKLPSLGHIGYDQMYDGYCIAAKGLLDGGVDLFLLETAQDPLQIKAALHALTDSMRSANVDLPIMVSVTIELSGTMLIGTDATTIAAILAPFNILSLGFNCGTGPDQVVKHVKTLSAVWGKPISVHANAGLPQNRGGVSYYPMGPEEFAAAKTAFTEIDGVSILGGCCGTSPNHIAELSKAVKGITPQPPSGNQEACIASLYETRELKQNPGPFLIGERSNATGSKAFRELLLAENYEGTLSVAQQQVRSGAHGIDVSVGFAGRNESKDMHELISLYSQKIPLPLMPDTIQLDALEVALKNIGGKPIINSVNLEDGVEKFDTVCALAKRFGASLVCLTIDETGMAKTQQQKVDIAERMYERATQNHGLASRDLVFDLLTFTVGSGDEEYHTAAIETIEAIRQFSERHPEVGFVLGVSNISFGLAKHAREYLNSVFLHHCLQAGLTMAIVNVKNTLPMHKISAEDQKACEDLLFNNRENGDPLFAFINHFEDATAHVAEDDEAYQALSSAEKIHKLLIDGDKERMMPLLAEAKEEIAPEKIVNELLIQAMKVVGELFGSGKMQLPFVLQSAEVMKAAVDYLNPYLPKKEKNSETTLILGTVKGDVHDVGKNLVDIILSNNGYKVINIGIKADLNDFVEAMKEHDADAIGMSGLLVKSTAVMKENLEALKEMGINIPVLVGGAALTDNFVDEYCRANYDGPVFYCRDAFEGIVAMSRIEEGNHDTNLRKSARQESRQQETRQIAIPDVSEIIMPRRDVRIPTPPFWGRRILDTDVKQLAYEWINHKVLFSHRWGYSGKGLSKEEKQQQFDEKFWPLFEGVKADVERLGLLEPTMIYGYWPARSHGNKLYILDEADGWLPGHEPDSESIDVISQNALHVLDFPRQERAPHRSLSDFIHPDKHDVLAFTCVSAGSRFSEYEKKLYDEGKYQEYYHVHGLGVELAEALAEVVHKQIRLDLGIAENEGHTLRDVQMIRYTGCRYSFGYPACPELSDSKVIFDLLKPEEFGIVLSETFQIHPEQSTTAVVMHHPEAVYFAVRKEH